MNNMDIICKVASIYSQRSHGKSFKDENVRNILLHRASIHFFAPKKLIDAIWRSRNVVQALKAARLICTSYDVEMNDFESEAVIEERETRRRQEKAARRLARRKANRDENRRELPSIAGLKMDRAPIFEDPFHHIWVKELLTMQVTSIIPLKNV